MANKLGLNKTYGKGGRAGAKAARHLTPPPPAPKPKPKAKP